LCRCEYELSKLPRKCYKNAIAVIMDELKVVYKKDVVFHLKYKDSVIGEDACDFVIGDTPCIIGVSSMQGYSEKLMATKIMRCMVELGVPTGMVVLFKNNDMYHQPILIREYTAEGNRINEFAGRTPLPIHQQE
jgi:hypothetical protein